MTKKRNPGSTRADPVTDPKESLLKRIRSALRDVPAGEAEEDWRTTGDGRRRDDLSLRQRTGLFAERVADYQAFVQLVNGPDLKAVLQSRCLHHGAVHVVVPDRFPEKWLPEGAQFLFDRTDSPLGVRDLDRADGVLTCCALAIAETGTIILDGGAGQGRRALSLIPDYHLCIVRSDQIVGSVPEAFGYFEQAVRRQARPLTFISGPSATSDIELNRVEGVHGPRRLDVLVVETDEPTRGEW